MRLWVGSHDSYSEKKRGVPSMRLLPSQGNHNGCAELFSYFGKANDCEAQSHYSMALIDRVHDTGWVINKMGDKITSLSQEVQELKSGISSKAMVAAEQRAADL
ncbi:hypothetical protein BHM03_00039256 [Ensete ventricosum]|nr:hypothetical protein BHM03_00039256 [Ensete ventricosum]